MRWLAYDPKWLIDLIGTDSQRDRWLRAKLAGCSRCFRRGDGLDIGFIEPASDPKREYLHSETVPLEPRGSAILDVFRIIGGQEALGGIEFFAYEDSDLSRHTGQLVMEGQES